MKKNRYRQILITCLSTSMTALLLLSGCGGDTSGYETESYDTAEYASESYDDYSDLGESAVDDSAYESQDDDAYDDNGEDVTEEAADDTGTAKSDRKLITTMEIDAETNNFDAFIAGIEAKTEALGGYAESVSVYGDADSHSRTAYYTLRIPAEKADSLVEEIEGKSNITSRSENVEDVTLSYVDITSKKKSLQTEYDRLNTMLESAETIDDLITLEERMSQVRYEIESIESQLRTYDNKINYTTINLNIDEVYDYTETPDPDPTYWQRLGKAMSTTMSGLWGFLQNFSIFIIVAIPVVIILAIPVVLVILLIRSIKKKIKKTDKEDRTDKKEKKEKKRSGPVFTTTFTPNVAENEIRKEERVAEASEEQAAEASEDRTAEEYKEQSSDKNEG